MQQQRHQRRADKLTAAATRRSTKVDGGAHKLSAAARPAHGSSVGDNQEVDKKHFTGVLRSLDFPSYLGAFLFIIGLL